MSADNFPTTLLDAFAFASVTIELPSPIDAVLFILSGLLVAVIIVGVSAIRRMRNK